MTNSKFLDEYYSDLQNDLKKNQRNFAAAFLGFMASLACAFFSGANSGWPWLVVSLGLLFFALCTWLDVQHTRVMIQFYIWRSRRE